MTEGFGWKWTGCHHFFLHWKTNCKYKTFLPGLAYSSRILPAICKRDSLPSSWIRQRWDPGFQGLSLLELPQCGLASLYGPIWYWHCPSCRACDTNNNPKETQGFLEKHPRLKGSQGIIWKLEQIQSFPVSVSLDPNTRSNWVTSACLEGTTWLSSTLHGTSLLMSKLHLYQLGSRCPASLVKHLAIRCHHHHVQPFQLKVSKIVQGQGCSPPESCFCSRTVRSTFHAPGCDIKAYGAVWGWKACSNSIRQW